jgi:hypothetical protein
MCAILKYSGGRSILTVKFSLTQRLALESLLGVQQGKAKDLFVFYDIQQKIKVPNRDEYIHELPNGGVLLDKPAIALAADLDVELEKEEVRKISEVLSSWEHFTPPDLEWIQPLMKQLER